MTDQGQSGGAGTREDCQAAHSSCSQPSTESKCNFHSGHPDEHHCKQCGSMFS